MLTFAGRLSTMSSTNRQIPQSRIILGLEDTIQKSSDYLFLRGTQIAFMIYDNGMMIKGKNANLDQSCRSARSCFQFLAGLASTEKLAGMDMLCSDKTGTLPQNIMTIESKLPWCDT